MIGLPVERPESMIDAVHDDIGRPPAGCVVSHEPGCHNQRRGRHVLRRIVNVASERVAKKSGRGDDLLRAAEPADRQIAQASTNGISNEQRSREHRHRRRDTEHDREVRAPVVRRAAQNQLHCGHCQDLLTRIPNHSLADPESLILNP